MKKLLAQPDTVTVPGFRDRTILEVFYATGLRIGELLGLCVRDVDLSGRTVFVAKGKLSKERLVPLGEAARRYLAVYIDRVRPLLLDRRKTGPNPEALFLNRYGAVLGKTGLEKKLCVYAGRAGIRKRITAHTFRHTLATEMLKAGADLRRIQEILGHRSPRTTQIYTHVVKGELKRIQRQCHPRERTDLPEGFTRYRGRPYLKEGDR
jgi:integrase/recombinase XerD